MSKIELCGATALLGKFLETNRRHNFTTLIYLVTKFETNINISVDLKAPIVCSQWEQEAAFLPPRVESASVLT